MSIRANFENLDLIENGIVLSFKNGQKKEISFSELDDIYVKGYKLKVVYELAFILLPFFLMLFCAQYVMLEKVVFLSLFAIIPVFVKAYRYKRYGLRICLKDGTIFKKNVSLKLKNQDVNLVNSIKRARLNYFVKNNSIASIKILDFV